MSKGQNKTIEKKLPPAEIKPKVTKTGKPVKPERIASEKYPGVYYRVSTKRGPNKSKNTIFWITWHQGGKRKWLKIGESANEITAQFAYEKLVEIKNDLRLGENPAILDRNTTPTFDTIIKDYFLKCESDGKNITSEKSRYINHIQPMFGKDTIYQITPVKCDKFKTKLLSKMAPASVKRIFTTMRAAINLAIKRKVYRGDNPFSHLSDFSMPKENNEGERFLSQSEALMLLKELERRSTQLWHMALISLLTGMRATEIFSLKGADIDEKNSLAIIRSKGGDREPVFLTQDALAILLQYQTTSDSLLFCNSKKQRINNISDTFNRVVSSLGLNNGVVDKRHKVWFHTLRHTFASWLAQSGEVGIYELMKLMRHRRIEMTLRYAHLIPDQQREKLSIISKIISG